MDFQGLLSDSQYVDYSFWNEYSSACSSSDVPSSPSSTTSMSSSLLGDDNSMGDLSTLVGSSLTALGEPVNDVTFNNLCHSGDEARVSESSQPSNHVFSNWMNLQPTKQYQDEEMCQSFINHQNTDSNSQEWCSDSKLSPCFDFSHSTAIDCNTRGGQSEKPKRRRVQSRSQRKAANVRERKRMVYLNDAFDNLRQTLPAFSYEKSLSRIETLKLAIKYISFMKDVTSADNK